MRRYGSMHLMARQGDREPWRHKQDDWSEKNELPQVDLDEDALRYR